jgi:hypothetical protein
MRWMNVMNRLEIYIEWWPAAMTDVPHPPPLVTRKIHMGAGRRWWRARGLVGSLDTIPIHPVDDNDNDNDEGSIGPSVARSGRIWEMLGVRYIYLWDLS